MSDRFCTLVFTIMLLGSVYIGWDTDGHYLRQALLVFAGYTIAGVFFFINSSED